jgi:hypothetical protein
MCAQCMVSAATAVASATGVRAWLAARDPHWLTPTRLRWVTRGLMVAAVVASATLVSGTG